MEGRSVGQWPAGRSRHRRLLLHSGRVLVFIAKSGFLAIPFSHVVLNLFRGARIMVVDPEGPSLTP
eukprot:6249051-Pyramimonas_sp.AAC.1